MIKKHYFLEILIFFVLTGLAVSGIRCVPVGHEGVFKRLGEVQHDKTLGEGLHYVIPFVTSVKPVTRKLIKVEADSSSASKDLQTVKTRITLQLSLSLVSFLHQKVGSIQNIIQVLIFPAIEESAKAVMALYTAENLIKERVKVKIGIEKKIKEFIKITLKNKDLDENSISIANVALTDFEFSVEFNKAIEEKVKAEQDALRAKNEKLKKITEAQANAEKIKLESIERANAIKREAQALKMNPLLIEYKKIEKWNGVLPKVTSGVIPILDANEEIK